MQPKCFTGAGEDFLQHVIFRHYRKCAVVDAQPVIEFDHPYGFILLILDDFDDGLWVLLQPAAGTTRQSRKDRRDVKHTHSSEDSSIGHVLECLGRLLTAHAKWHGCWAVWRLYKAKVWLDSTITHGGARKSKPRILMQIYLCIMLLTCIFHFIKRDTLTDSRRHLEYGRYRNHIIHMYHIHTQI